MQPHMRTRFSAAERNGRDAAAGMFRFTLVITFLVPCVSQHGPCYTCEEYRMSHPHSHPYQQIRGKCHYPCNCPNEKLVCPEGVTLIIDGCGCCPMCAKQHREECDKIQLCDNKHNLECIYKTPFSSSGTCIDKMAGCKMYSSQWSECSTTCGYGISYRVSNDNSQCELRNETRICQIRQCEASGTFLSSSAVGAHRHRQHHDCRATTKSRIPVRITDQNNCTSTKSYFPNYCNYCRDMCCKPEAVTTKIMPLQCQKGDVVERNVMWILKCSCEKGRQQSIKAVTIFRNFFLKEECGFRSLKSLAVNTAIIGCNESAFVVCYELYRNCSEYNDWMKEITRDKMSRWQYLKSRKDNNGKCVYMNLLEAVEINNSHTRHGLPSLMGNNAVL